ncbi:MAG TPA: F0F1 ATP synthase subunit delta [Usitatibacteraceae bacterium]|nr:F0F1 ATP synthase subunit delta [Usitatibacteraceae bacterium]
MAEIATLARPYAEASFRSALEAKDLAGWSDGLALAGAIASDAQMADLLGNPRLTRMQKLELFYGVGGDGLSAHVRNLVTILVDGARASLLPEIAAQFDALKRAHESVLKVRIVSARALADAEYQDLVATLGRKYGRRIEATVEIDAALIGGARVHVGDEVIHASMRDALAQMAVALSR